MAGLFSSATLEQVRSASDIVDVVGSYVPLKRAGANFVALCPFHREKSPSFNVNPHKQIFHCFGCHKGGDVFTFVKEFESIDFPEAVKRLAERARIPLDFEKTPGQQQSRHVKETLLQIHEQITQRWQHALANDAAGQIARDYLAKRGVSDEATKLFRVGYAPEAWDDTVNWAKSKNYELPVMEQAGLIIQKVSDRGQRSNADTPTSDLRHYYDRFRGRLIFPICDEQGRVVGFSGRVLSGDEKTAKYVNSPETPIFTKGKVLFALDKAKRAILDAGCAVVCEGQLDTISCHAKGVKHVVAPQGTALTAQHVAILQRYTSDIVLCFDGDNAGRKAAARGFDELVKLKVPFRVAEIPPPDDPDSFLKKFGVEAFFDLLVRSRDFFEWYLDYLSQLNDITSDRGRIAIIRGMAEVLNHPENLMLTDTYAQKTALRLAVSPESVRAEFKKVSRPTMTKEVPEQTPVADEVAPRPSLQEFWLLKLMLLSDDHIDWIATHLNLDWLTHPVVRQVVSMRLAAHRDNTWQGVAALLANLESEDARSLVTEASTDDRSIPNPEQQLKDVLLRLRNQFVDRQLTALIHRASQPELPEADQHESLRRQAELRQLKRQPLQPFIKQDMTAGAG